MPRRLPWTIKRDQEPSTTPGGSGSLANLKELSSSQSASTRALPSQADHEQTERQRAQKRRYRDNVLRSSSASPPPEEPPEEEFMIEGLDNDDAYVMVEDEFLAIAKQFTRHLHQAEYERRKREVERENNMGIADLNRREAAQRGLQPGSLQATDLDDTGTSSVLDDSDYGDRNVHAGTILHSLLRKPRKSQSRMRVIGTTPRHSQKAKLEPVHQGNALRTPIREELSSNKRDDGPGTLRRSVERETDPQEGSVDETDYVPMPRPVSVIHRSIDRPFKGDSTASSPRNVRSPTTTAPPPSNLAGKASESAVNERTASSPGKRRRAPKPFVPKTSLFNIFDELSTPAPEFPRTGEMKKMNPVRETSRQRKKPKLYDEVPIFLG